jgi:PAS domain S-box-containing protein
LISIDFFNEELLSRIFSIKEKAEVFKLFKDIFSKPRGYATIIFSYLPETNNLRVEQFSTLLNRWEDRKQQLEGTTSAVMENGILYRVLRGKETVYDNTYSVLKEIFPEIHNDTRSLDLGYSIVVPLTSQTKVIGALLVSSVGLDPSSIPEVQILGNSISAILNIVDHHLDHVTTEQTLRENEERLNSIIEKSPNTVIWADPQSGLIVNCNKAAESLLEKKSHEIIGHPITTILPLEKAEYYLNQFRDIKKVGLIMIDQEIITSSGKIKHVDFYAFPVIVNKWLLLQGILNDVSGRKKNMEDLLQSEAKYRQLVENAHEGIWATDSKMETTFVNRRMAEMLGYTVEEMLGRSVYEFMDEKNIAISKNKLEQRKKGIRESYELEFIRKGGKRIFTILTISPILDEKGIFAGALGFITDITEKKKIEEELNKSENRYQTVFENTGTAMAIIEEDMMISLVNKEFENLTGYTREEVEGKKKWSDFIVKEDLEKMKKYHFQRRIDLNTIPRNYEFHGVSKQGIVKTILLNIDVIPETKKSVASMIDITQRKRIEEDLKESEFKYRSIFENAIEGMYQSTPEGRYLTVNPSFAQIFGYKSPEEMIQKITDIAHQIYVDPRDRERLKKALAKQGYVEGFEVEEYRKDDQKIWVSHFTRAVKGPDGKILYFEGNAIEVTKRKKMEEDLKASGDRFRSVVNATADAIISIDSKEKIVFWNKASEDIFGYSADEAIGKPITLVIPEQIRGRHENMMRKFMSSTVVISKVGPIGSARRKDGSLFPIEASFSKWKQKGETFFMAMIRDITERLKIEDELKKHTEHLSELVKEKTEELRGAEQLVAMGQVATMVGHDLRNPLQVLVNLAYLVKMKVGELPSSTGIELQDQLTTVEKQIEYMNKIVSDLQDYGRTLEPHYTRVKLNELIDDTLATVNVPERVKVLVHTQEGFPSLMVDAFMMQRVFTNLINNAIQAMPEGGKLTISTSEDGDMALICVKDTGVGISEENMSKLFTPLFTTKAKGQGLGLPVCKRLVEANGGSISVESQVGVGSTFKVRIPLEGENI